MNETDSIPDKPDTSDSNLMQASYGLIFVILAVVVAIAALGTGSFRMFTNEYAFEEFGGPGMLIELVVLFFIAAVFVSLDARQARKIAKLEKMVSRLLLAQNSSAHCKKCGANIFASAKFCPECGEKQA